MLVTTKDQDTCCEKPHLLRNTLGGRAASRHLGNQARRGRGRGRSGEREGRGGAGTGRAGPGKTDPDCVPRFRPDRPQGRQQRQTTDKERCLSKGSPRVCGASSEDDRYKNDHETVQQTGGDDNASN